VLSLHGKNSICDKKTFFDICTKIDLPHGFDGPMHAIGMHDVDSFNAIGCAPVQYGETKDMIINITYLLLSAYQC